MKTLKNTLKTPFKRLSEHTINGTFYGFKTMIGGRRFYFGRDFGILTNGTAEAKRANQAADIFRSEYERLQAAGISAWTDEAVGTAKANARNVLLGAAMASKTVANASAAPMATVGALNANNSASGLPSPTVSLHQSIDAYIAYRQGESGISVSADTVSKDAWKYKLLKRSIADVPMASIGPVQLHAMTNHFKRRPKTLRYGEPMKVQTVINVLSIFRQFFDWARKSCWTAFADWDELFQVEVERLLTDDEKDADNSPKQYTESELATLYANATTRTRLYLLLGLQCAMGQKEISTLRKAHIIYADGKPAFIERKRNKTGVKAKWKLWDETATALEYVLLEQSTMSAFDIEPVNQPKPNTDNLAILTEDGYPLKHGNTDAIALAWQRLMNNKGVKGNVNNGDGYGFYCLRRTAAQLVQDIAGHEVKQVFGAWSTVDPSGRKTVSEKHYTQRSQADFDRVAVATDQLRLRLQPMFDVKAAPKGKPGPKAKDTLAA